MAGADFISARWQRIILCMIDGSYRYVVGKLAKKVRRELEDE